MTARQAALASALLILAAFAYTMFLYPALPERIPIHWDLNGRVDGWMNKPWGAYLGPLCTAGLAALMFLLPAISPRHFRVEPFAPTYHYLIVVVVAMMLFMNVVALQAALHPGLDLGRVLISGIFLALAAMGNVLGKVRRNFWIGIRTPWTLANDTVWIATHRIAARWLVAAGLGGAVALWLGVPPLACFILLLVALLAPALYSLVLYKRLEREEQA